MQDPQRSGRKAGVWCRAEVQGQAGDRQGRSSNWFSSVKQESRPPIRSEDGEEALGARGEARRELVVRGVALRTTLRTTRRTTVAQRLEDQHRLPGGTLHAAILSYARHTTATYTDPSAGVELNRVLVQGIQRTREPRGQGVTLGEKGEDLTGEARESTEVRRLIPPPPQRLMKHQ